MRLMLSLFLTAIVFIERTHGIVCTANICDLVDCIHHTPENCPGKFVKNGGYCGCCDACLAILKPGDTCYNLFLAGSLNTTICPDNYHCDTIPLSVQRIK
nr:hypothetical protein BgiMline_021632 [Biomphalaria glabrata]